MYIYADVFLLVERWLFVGKPTIIKDLLLLSINSYMHPWLWYGFHSFKYVPNQVYMVKGTWIPSHFPKLWDLWAWTTREKGVARVQKIFLELLCVVNCLVADLTKKMIQSSFIEERNIGLCLFFSPEAIYSEADNRYVLLSLFPEASVKNTENF